MIHPGLYFRVNGKLQKLPVGHELELEPEKGERMVLRKFAEAVTKPEPKKKPLKRGPKAKKKE